MDQRSDRAYRYIRALYLCVVKLRLTTRGYARLIGQTVRRDTDLLSVWGATNLLKRGSVDLDGWGTVAKSNGS